MRLDPFVLDSFPGRGYGVEDSPHGDEFLLLFFPNLCFFDKRAGPPFQH